jgi:eukaryotic-like serine/threonine-protein kinase
MADTRPGTQFLPVRRHAGSGTVTFVWTPRRDPKQDSDARESQDAPDAPAESMPDEEETTAGGRSRGKVVTVAVPTGAVIVAAAVVAYALSHPPPPVTAGGSSTTATTGGQPPAHEQLHDQPPTTDQLTATITDYYTLLPDDPEAGWDLLTTHLQALYQSGFAYYQQGWEIYSAVAVDDINDISYLNGSDTPGRAYATVTYHYKDGRSPRVERTNFVVAKEDGEWKIDWLWTIDPEG